MEAFREPWLPRSRRRAVTLTRAIRAGRARAKREPQHKPQVDGAALRDLVAEVAADAQLIEIRVNRPPWTPTGLDVAAGEQLTWLAWGFVYLVKPLRIGAAPRATLRGRVAGGTAHASSHDTFTFTADRNGPVELASVAPGELRENGSIATDRILYRAITGSLAAVVARWASGTDPREPLEAVAARDPSGLGAAEAARLADPPTPPRDGTTIHCSRPRRSTRPPTQALPSPPARRSASSAAGRRRR